MVKITPGQSEVTVAGVVQAVTSASFDDEKGNQVYLRGPDYSRLGSLLRANHPRHRDRRRPDSTRLGQLGNAALGEADSDPAVPQDHGHVGHRPPDEQIPRP